MTTKALICVDFEKEWTDQSSSYFLGDIVDVVEKTNKVIDICREKGYKIIFTTHIEKNSNTAFMESSENVEIIEKIHKKDSDILIKKNKISPFFKTNLEQELEGIQEIIICGILTNLCVRSLVQDAYDRDFKIKVIKDCCKAFNKKTHEFTIQDLQFTRKEIDFLNQEKFVG